jgi:hypothetical protein
VCVVVIGVWCVEPISNGWLFGWLVCWLVFMEVCCRRDARKKYMISIYINVYILRESGRKKCNGHDGWIRIKNEQ